MNRIETAILLSYLAMAIAAGETLNTATKIRRLDGSTISVSDAKSSPAKLWTLTISMNV